MNRNIPITFILFLILVVVVSVLVENHFKNDYLGGSYFNTLLKDGHVLLTSDRELGMTFNSIKRCGFNNNQIKKAERVITPGIDKKWFNFMFLSYNFLYSENNDYYYDTKIKGFNKDINIPYVDEGNSFKYMRLFSNLSPRIF